MSIIGVERQWLLTVDFAGQELYSDELYNLNISDEIGLNLPVLQLSINTKDEKKLKAICRKDATISVGIGKYTINEHYIFKTFKRIVQEG